MYGVILFYHAMRFVTSFGHFTQPVTNIFEYGILFKQGRIWLKPRILSVDETYRSGDTEELNRRM